MKKILVTGGAGFIGSHLVERLLLDGHKIIVIDDFSMGKMSNLPVSSNLTVIETSILDDIKGYFDEVDIVYHLAALTRPQESFTNPEDTYRVNVLGTLAVLTHAKDYEVGRVVFMSSTSMYGEQDKLPTPEDVVPNPMSPYALTKYLGELECEFFSRVYGLRINRIRPFNVYGTRQDPKGGYAAAVPKFIDMLSKGETPWITGDGKQARDFIYVEDLVDLLVLAGERDVSGEAFNGGSGVNTSINDIYKTISGLMGKSTKPNYISPVYEPRQTLGDISKAKELLGWTPKTSLKDGLKLTIEGTLK